MLTVNACFAFAFIACALFFYNSTNPQRLETSLYFLRRTSAVLNNRLSDMCPSFLPPGGTWYLITMETIWAIKWRTLLIGFRWYLHISPLFCMSGYQNLILKKHYAWEYVEFPWHIHKAQIFYQSKDCFLIILHTFRFKGVWLDLLL